MALKQENKYENELAELPFSYSTHEPSPEHNAEAALARLRLKISSNKPFSFHQLGTVRWYYWASVAVLLVLLGITSYVTIRKTQDLEVVRKLAHERFDELGGQVYETSKGVRSQVTLPDGTVAWINASSRITVEKGFGLYSRRVLLEGEAYFDVYKAKTPFIVQTKGMSVKALGTTFNVKAYPDDKTVETVLVNGKVEVNPKPYTEKDGESIKLKPAQRLAIHSENRKLQIEANVDVSHYISWLDNKLVFNQTPMVKVVGTLERWFNVSIELANELAERPFTGSFFDSSIEEIISSIEQQLGLSCSYNDSKDSISITG